MEWEYPYTFESSKDKYMEKGKEENTQKIREKYKIKTMDGIYCLCQKRLNTCENCVTLLANRYKIMQAKHFRHIAKLMNRLDVKIWWMNVKKAKQKRNREKRRKKFQSKKV